MCKCIPENTQVMFCGKTGCQWTDTVPENSYSCAAEGCHNIVLGGGKRSYCELHRKKPELATVGVPDFKPPTKRRENGLADPLTQDEIDEFLGLKVGNIESWFCSDWIKKTAYRMLNEIVERRKNDRVSEVSEK